MRDFFQAQKHIIIALIVIIAITVVSGYFIDEPSLLNEPLPNEPLIKENDSLLREIPKERSAPNEGAKTNSEITPTPQTQEEPTAPNISAKLIISGQTYSVSLPQQSSAYDLMIKVREVHGISFGGREYTGLGFFVDEINGIKNNAGGNSKYWIYSINGRKAQVGVSQYLVQEGDIISWNYEDEIE